MDVRSDAVRSLNHYGKGERGQKAQAKEGRPSSDPVYTRCR